MYEGNWFDVTVIPPRIEVSACTKYKALQAFGILLSQSAAITLLALQACTTVWSTDEYLSMYFLIPCYISERERILALSMRGLNEFGHVNFCRL
jgi:hypothetical protein